MDDEDLIAENVNLDDEPIAEELNTENSAILDKLFGDDEDDEEA